MFQILFRERAGELKPFFIQDNAFQFQHVTPVGISRRKLYFSSKDLGFPKVYGMCTLFQTITIM